MAMFAFNSLHKTTSPYTLNHENNDTHLEDASFSSYLTLSKDPFYQIRLERKKTTEDGELGIFSAEKYFNGAMDEEKNGVIESKKDATVSLQTVTPEIKIEASLNMGSDEKSDTQSTMPQVLLRTRSRRKNKANCNRLLIAFASTCACFDEKSVDVDENNAPKEYKTTEMNAKVYDKEITEVFIDTNKDVTGAVETKRTSIEAGTKQDSDKVGIGAQKDGNFSFPVLSPGVGIAADEKLTEEEDRGYKADENTESDSSSDLFEIENFQEHEDTEVKTKLSCRSNKSVKAEGDADHKTEKVKNNPRRCQRSYSFARKERFQTDNPIVSYFKSANEQRLLSRSHSVGSCVGFSP